MRKFVSAIGFGFAMIGSLVVACSGASSSVGQSDDASAEGNGLDEASVEMDASAVSGEDGASSIDGGDAGPDALPPRGTGSVLVSSDTVLYWAALASFKRASTGGGCTETSVGACRTTDCPAGDGGAPVEDGGTPHAGRIRITGPELVAPGITMLPNATTKQYPTLQGTNRIWSPGQTMLFAALGADVPAFSQTVVVPKGVNVTAPTFAAAGSSKPLPKNVPLSLSWTGGAGSSGVLHVYFRANRPARKVTLECEFPPGSGAAQIPSATLMTMPDGAALGVIGTRTTKKLAAGDYDVEAVLDWPANAGNGPAQGTFNFQ